MISVVIYINNVPILCRSAQRIKGEDNEECTYKCDEGTEIKHEPHKGAVALVHKMLDTVKLGEKTNEIKKNQ